MEKQGRLEVKNVKELMEDMGFNPKSPVSTQKAFLRNLFKSAYNIDLPLEDEKKDEIKSAEQLDLFDKAS